MKATVQPLKEMVKWIKQAEKLKLELFDAMTLATTGQHGQPNARMVLYKGLRDNKEILFVTNYQSTKGKELSKNPRSALVFFWPSLNRQIRIQGKVRKVTRAESIAYFASRPRQSQLGAWVSEQSEPISGRDTLEKRLAHFTKKFHSQHVPCPPHWGGYALDPSVIEFWIGRENRLHDRFEFKKMNGRLINQWKLKRLAP